MQHSVRDGTVAERQDFGPIIGTPFKVYLFEGTSESWDPISGTLVTEVIDLPGLIAAIVQCRVLHPRKLSGDDLKFIRSALCLKSKQIAEFLDLSPEHYSRCETGLKVLSTDKEKSYRMFAFIHTSLRNTEIVSEVEISDKQTADLLDFPPEKAQKAMKAFCKIFYDLKIPAIHDPSHDLELCFFRQEAIRPSGNDDPRSDADMKWESEIDCNAA